MHGVDPAKPPPSTLGIVMWLLAALMGAFLSYEGAHQALCEVRFGADGRTVVGEVTGARLRPSRSSVVYLVRYRFRPPGARRDYTAGDALGRTDLWVGLDTEESWVDARQRGAIEVLYLPADPRINRPQSADASLTHVLAALGASALLFVVGVTACLALAWRRVRWKRARARPRG